MSAGRVGIMGGTFDPIHCGHVDLGRAAVLTLGLSKLYVVPSHIPPHRTRPAASSYHRFAMVALAASAEQAWEASDVELVTDAPSYTSGTLRRFHEAGYAAADLFFVMGADAFADIASWRDYPRLLDCAHFAVVTRPGHPVEALPLKVPTLADRMRLTRPFDAAAFRQPGVFLIDQTTADVSSTAIRQHRAEGRSIDGLVAPLVQQHIERHGLYASASPERREDDWGRAPAAGRLHDTG